MSFTIGPTAEDTTSASMVAYTICITATMYTNTVEREFQLGNPNFHRYHSRA